MSGKNGFTIVEIVIVLVVIGIIAGMAIHVFGLKDAAELKSDVARMAKFEVAIRTYYADNLKLPPAEDTGRIIIDNLTDSGYLVDADRISTWDRKNWEFYRCAIDNDSYRLEQTGQSVCMAMEGTGTVSGTLSCAIETQLDDKNYGYGLGRSSDTPTTFDFNNCDNSTGFSFYRYRVL